MLDRSEQQWREAFPRPATAHPDGMRCSLYARRQIEDLAYGHGWDVEYPREVWRLRNMGIDEPHATLHFDRITQPWLKDLAKRWIRWRAEHRASAPTGRTHRAGALTRFGQFLASPTVGVDRLAEVDRALLERYLADLHTELAGSRSTAHAHRAAQHLPAGGPPAPAGTTRCPANAMFFPEDYPSRTELLPRALAEHVMAQVEHPANLDRWHNPAYRLVTLILIRCGLRITDAAAPPSTASSPTPTAPPTCATSTTR